MILCKEVRTEETATKFYRSANLYHNNEIIQLL